MARPRSFDEQAVLDAAAYTFRVHGFAETSTEQLCEATGVRRSSLYNTFVSKDELFLQALRHYTDQMRHRQKELLGNHELSGGQRLVHLLESIIDEEEVAREAGHSAGCMVVQSFMSPDVRERDHRVQAILDKDVELRLALLKQVVEQGQQDGSIDSGTDAEAIAFTVVTIISGLRISAYAGLTIPQLRDSARIGLSGVLT